MTGRTAHLVLWRKLQALSPKARLDALIEGADAQALVRAVPAQDLYAAIAEVGLADSAEIVQLASAAQFRAFIDLGGWKADRMDPHRVLTWLRAARGDEPEDFLAKLKALDMEALELLLKSFVRIYDLEEDPDANPSGVTIETPEGKYLIELTVDSGVEIAAMRQLIFDLTAQNPFETTRLFEAIRWELSTELEETAYQFRVARLADLGFPKLDEALALFAYVDPGMELYAGPSSAPATTALVSNGERVNFLQRGLQGLDAQEREALEQELRFLVNQALVADAADPGDVAQIRRLGEVARDYLNLGLEHLSGQEPAMAADVLRRMHLKQVFRIGFSLTLKLKFRIDRLAKRPIARLDGQFVLLPEEEATVVAAWRKRPMRALKVEGAEPVPFRSRRELEEAATAIHRAEGQQELFAALLGGPEGARASLARFGASTFPELGAEKLLLSAVGTALLDHAAAARPIPSVRVGEVLSALFNSTARGLEIRPEGVASAERVLLGVAPPDAHQAVSHAVRRVVQRAAAALSHVHPVQSAWDLALVGTVFPLEGERPL